MDVASWLQDLGLERYAPAFRDNDIDAAVLPSLTGDDLEKLGVPSVGHRRKLLDAIAALRVGTVPIGPANTEPTEDAGLAGRITPPLAQAERRQITVLFCDLVGSTELSTRLDPEDMSELLRTYRNCCASTIGQWDGYLAKYLGDGVLAYFGWPRSHEDDAERAVRAGLALVEAVGKLMPAPGARLAARVGIATGQVVVGDLIGEGDAQEHNVVGETPNLAARLQALAPPDAIVIAPATRRLLGSLFEFGDVGPVVAKGFAEPVPAYQVLRASAAESRFEALRAEQTPLVGREEEIGVLLRRWQQAKAGEGQVVLFSGEPGIGKSRIGGDAVGAAHGRAARALALFLLALPHDQPAARVCQPARARRRLCARRPAADQARQAGGAARPVHEESGRGCAAHCRTAVHSDRGTLPAADTEPGAEEGADPCRLARSAGIAGDQQHGADDLRGRALDRSDLARAPGKDGRFVWSDGRCWLVITFRPEFQPPWVGLAHVTMHPLNKLNRRESTLLLERLTGGKPLPREVAEQIIEHTDGVPLFMEELTKTVLEGALLEEQADRYVLTGPLPPLAIPTSLQASLMARLDRLASLKDVAQVGAAIGREFSYDLLAAVAGRSEPDLQRALDQLVEAGLLFRRGTPPRASLMFKHALVQDAAYSSLLRSRRQELHARIAAVLEQSFPAIVQSEPELLAQHYTQAGLADRAAEYWQRAGDRALLRSANLEAIQHFNQGIGLIDSMPAARERQHRQFGLYLGLGSAARTAKGYYAPETLQAYSRARDLIGAATSIPDQIRVLYGLWGVHYTRGELQAARAVAEQALQRVAGVDEPEPHAFANRMLGEVLWSMGDLVAARSYLERALEFCGALEGHMTDLRFSMDHKVTALAFHGWILWPLGYPERAQASAAEGLALSSHIPHAFTIAMGQFGMTYVAEFAGNAQQLLESAEAQVKICEQNGISSFGNWGRFSRGHARYLAGDIQTGINEMTAWVAPGLFRPMQLGFLAEAHASAGERDRALELLDEAIALAVRTKEGLFEAELHRIRGEVLLAQDRDAAEASFQKALEVARRQSAKLWELRTTVNLARLWHERGKSKLAEELLAPIYGWFTEGFDTADLQAAKAMLQTLARD